ncbi:MAG: AAA family ATPase [bacterium]|jgi:MoxR-like ATPase
MSYNKFQEIIEEISNIFFTSKNILKLIFSCLLSKGHLLIEDVPGVGKTTLSKIISKSLDLKFKRIQGSPDLLATDITGLSIYNPKTMEFDFKPGPVFTNILLVDEINRIPPKSQSALLEVMEEHQVTIDGKTYVLPIPFFVIATENPLELAGAYPLIEAQLDRFLMKINLGYPTKNDLYKIVNLYLWSNSDYKIEKKLTKEDVLQAFEEIKKVDIEQSIIDYVINIFELLHNDNKVYLPPSPRALLHVLRVASSFAFLEGRDYVIPDDIKNTLPFVLAHRIILREYNKYSDLLKFVNETINRVKVPISRIKGYY